MKNTLILLVAVAFTTACGQKQNPVLGRDAGWSDGDGGQGDPGPPVTYSGEIKSILDANCTRCHASTRQGADRNGAPVGLDFDSYLGIKAYGSRANARIQAGTMPPSGPLAEADKARFQAWIDQGMPE